MAVEILLFKVLIFKLWFLDQGEEDASEYRSVDAVRIFDFDKQARVIPNLHAYVIQRRSKGETFNALK